MDLAVPLYVGPAAGPVELVFGAAGRGLWAAVEEVPDAAVPAHLAGQGHALDRLFGLGEQAQAQRIGRPGNQPLQEGVQAVHLVEEQLVYQLHAAEETRVTWYGNFKLDLARDSGVSSNGNFILYVKPGATATLNLTARQTRLGANIERGKMKGRVEFDFYGESPENKNTLMLRHAYITVPAGPLMLEAGQGSDLISPLVPATLNYTVAWGAGNIGYRRPKVKLYQQTSRFYWGAAVARNISADLDGDKLADGETSGKPALQGRLGLSASPAGKKLGLGASAHYGWNTCPPPADRKYNNWSVGGDLKLALSAELILLAEAYTGSNLGQYAGAIYNTDRVEGLRSSGGWANAQYQLAAPLFLSAGGGLDQVRRTDLEGVNQARATNAFVFVNAQYELLPGYKLGLEVSNWKTEYLNPKITQRDTRLQWSMQGSF